MKGSRLEQLSRPKTAMSPFKKEGGNLNEEEKKKEM